MHQRAQRRSAFHGTASLVYNAIVPILTYADWDRYHRLQAFILAGAPELQAAKKALLPRNILFFCNPRDALDVESIAGLEVSHSIQFII